MSPTPDPHAEPLDEGALLAAYLDGDTDEVTTARIERRLADDDTFAARLDAVADVRARLQRLSDVRAPEQARQRLRERLVAERGGQAPTVTQPHHAGRRSRRWLTGPAAAAAAVALVAVLGLGALVASFGGRGGSAAGEAGGLEEAADMEEAGSAADTAEAPAAGTGSGSDAAADARATDGGEADAEVPDQPVPTVGSDADIAARALRQLDRELRPAELRARERRLRRSAGLSTDRLCVRDLEARAVDVVDEDGRVSLVVVLVGADAQIVLLDPRTCAPVRTIVDDG